MHGCARENVQRGEGEGIKKPFPPGIAILGFAFRNPPVMI